MQGHTGKSCGKSSVLQALVLSGNPNEAGLQVYAIALSSLAMDKARGALHLVAAASWLRSTEVS